ncbi:hypothetical protein PS1_047189 [Malus domestica]
MEGEGNHVPHNHPHPGKYRALRRAQENIVMMPTPGWRPVPFCFGTISLEKGIPSPMLEDAPCEIPRQLLNFDITTKEEVPELMLTKDAQVWMEVFVYQIGGKKEEVPRPNKFHVNITYVLSAMFYAEPDQLATMEGDYLATKPMMALVSVKEAGKRN